VFGDIQLSAWQCRSKASYLPQPSPGVEISGAALTAFNHGSQPVPGKANRIEDLAIANNYEISRARPRFAY